MTNEQYDLILIHAPSVFDFRDRDDILFAFLSTGGTIAVSPVYEMYPLGLKALHSSLTRKGKKVAIINLADMMLKDPDMDVRAFLGTLNARMFGIDLFWMVHSQGSLAVAELLKDIHPGVPVTFGGISASLLYRELIEYPQVDYVVIGAVTSAFIEQVLDGLDGGCHDKVPNLCWKDSEGKVRINEFTRTDVYHETVDWGNSDSEINYFIIIPGAGCEYNCTLCGGSNYSMQKFHNVSDGFAEKSVDTFLEELQTIKEHKGNSKRLVTLHHWFENKDLLKKVLDTLTGGNIKTMHYTLFHLLSKEHLDMIAAYEMKPVFEVSIESHDPEVRKMCGRTSYSNEDLESWLDYLFENNRGASVEIYFMIGLPRQTQESVMGDVAYADHLLTKYAQYDINAYICPMVPFLVHSSIAYENAEKFGYKILFNKLSEYEKALSVLHWKDSLNYETEWMTREQIVEVSYKACRELVISKQKVKKLPKVLAGSIIEKIDSTVELLNEIEGYDNDSLPQELRDKVREYNREILKSSPTQQSPFNFSVYKNWYE